MNASYKMSRYQKLLYHALGVSKKKDHTENQNRLEVKLATYLRYFGFLLIEGKLL